MRAILGIDPGLRGGIGGIVVEDGYAQAAFAYPMPLIEGSKDVVDVRRIQQIFTEIGMIAIVMIEKVHSMPGQGVSSTFTFGREYGRIMGALDALQVPYDLVTPQAWKKVVLAGTEKGKGDAVQWVSRNHPKLSLLETPRCRKPHDGMADALCLAEYGRITKILRGA